MKYYKNILSVILMSIFAVFSSYGMKPREVTLEELLKAKASGKAAPPQAHGINESTFDESKLDWMNESSLGNLTNQPGDQPFPQRPLSYFSDRSEPLLERVFNLNTTDLSLRQKAKKLKDLYQEHLLTEPQKTAENSIVPKPGEPSEFKIALNQWLKTDRILKKEIKILREKQKQLPTKKRQLKVLHPRQKTSAKKEEKQFEEGSIKISAPLVTTENLLPNEPKLLAPALPPRKRTTPDFALLKKEWTNAASSLEKQLDTFIKNSSQKSLAGQLIGLVTSQKDPLVVQIEENITDMINFLEKHIPRDKNYDAIKLLTAVRQRVEKSDINYLNDRLTQLKRMQQEIASLIPTEPKKEQPQQMVLLPREKDAIPALIDQTKKSFSEAIEAIYNLESQIQKELTALDTIEKPTDIALHRSHIKDTLATIAQLLQNTNKEFTKTGGVQFTKTLLIAKTLHNFHRLELDKDSDTNNFVANFIKIADLISLTGIAFDKVDQEFVQYILKNRFFQDDFVTLRLVPEKKQKEFADAYIKIFNTLYPPIIPEIPEVPAVNYPQPQEHENPSEEYIVPDEPIIAQEPTIEEFDLEKSTKLAAMQPQTEIEQNPAKGEIEPERKFKHLPFVAENLEENIVKNLENRPELFMPTELKIKRSKQSILNPYKEPITLENENENPFSKESKELYDLEKKIQKILIALDKAIEEGNPNTLLKNHLTKEQSRMTELLKSTIIKDKPINVSIQVAKTLQDFHHLELDMLEDLEEAIVTESFVIDVNNFVDNFIKIAHLIQFSSPDDLNEYDREFIKYILNSPLFKKYFTTKKLVQRSKKEEFEAAYIKIHNALYPADIATASEIVEQPKKDVSPVVITNEPKVKPESIEMKLDQKADITQPLIGLDQNNPQVAVRNAPAQPAPTPTPSFWSFIPAPVRNFVSNVVQIIKNIIGSIASLFQR
jgi:hypothetical protein